MNFDTRRLIPHRSHANAPKTSSANTERKPSTGKSLKSSVGSGASEYARIVDDANTAVEIASAKNSTCHARRDDQVGSFGASGKASSRASVSLMLNRSPALPVR